MGKKVDLTGKRFGRLAVVGIAERDRNGRVYWNCKCDCGKETVVSCYNLQGGHTKSCGCYKAENTKLFPRHLKHGKCNTRLYKIWGNMFTRCYNHRNKLYVHYGARGIKVCSEWQDFQTFYDWAMANGYADDLTIDRINVNGNYAPSNCRWATIEQQANNKRTNRVYELNGEKLNIAQIIEKYNISYKTLWTRLNRGWNIEEAVLCPIDKNHTSKRNMLRNA